MSVPLSLAYAVNRLQGYSTNYFRLETVNQSTATNFSTIQLNLPENSIVNLKSLALHMKASTEGDITFTNVNSQQDTLHTMLPRMDQLIERMELYAGGIQCGSSGFQQYNTVSTVMRNTKTELQRSVSYDRVLNNGEIVINPLDYYETERPYILNNFMGLLGTSSPDYLSTDLLPSMQLRLYLSGPEVLGAVQASRGVAADLDTNASQSLIQAGRFVLNDLYFTVETITFADGLFDAAIDRRIRDEGHIEVPFCNYYTFFQTNSDLSQSTKFSLSSQSIDTLTAVHRPADYRQRPRGLIKIQNGMGDAYQPSYFNFYAGGVGSLQFNVNNMFVPNYRSNALDAFNLLTIAKADNYDPTAGCRTTSVNNWFNNFFQFMVRLNMPMDGMGTRNISGLDSRGLASQMYYQTEASNNELDQIKFSELGTVGNEVMIIAQCTSTLKIGSGRQIQVDI